MFTLVEGPEGGDRDRTVLRVACRADSGYMHWVVHVGDVDGDPLVVQVLEGDSGSSAVLTSLKRRGLEAGVPHKGVGVACPPWVLAEHMAQHARRKGVQFNGRVLRLRRQVRGLVGQEPAGTASGFQHPQDGALP